MNIPGARAVAWFDTQPQFRVETALQLSPGVRSEIKVELPEPSFNSPNDLLQVSIQGPNGKELWHKQISVMLIKQPPVWMIGIMDESDDRLIARAWSFNEPASLEVRGAELNVDSYVPERRAYRLTVRDNTVAITIKPGAPCINPVFELLDAPETLARVALAGQPLQGDQYAWDGQTLWWSVDVTEPTQLELEFKK